MPAPIVQKIVQSAQLKLENELAVSLQRLQPGIDYACNDPSRPNTCVGKSDRARFAYRDLQLAITQHIIQTQGTAGRTPPLTAAMDPETVALVKSLIKETKSLPHSQMFLEPWKFAALIRALPKTKEPPKDSIPVTPAPVASEEKKFNWLWVAAGGGVVAALGAIVAVVKRKKSS
jgi:hypothetical protein